METYKHTVNLGNKNEEVKAFCAGDAHFGTKNLAEEEFIIAVDNIIADPAKHKFFFWMGDSSDAITPSDKRFDMQNMDAKLFYVDEQYRYFEKFLLKMKKAGIKIGLHLGNHGGKFSILTSTNFTKDICNRNGFLYLGHSCLHLLELKYGGKILKRWRIYSSHGASIASTPGGAINSLDRKQLGIFADLYLQGHNHKLSDDVEAVLWQDENADYDNLSDHHQKSRYVWLGNTGSFLKTFVEGSIGYGERKEYRPNVIGHLTGVFTKDKMWLYKNLY